MDQQVLTGSTLARKLTIYLAILSFVAVLASTAIQLYLSYKQNMRQVSSTFTLIEASYINSLSHNIWVYNDKQIGIQLDGLLGLPGIEYANINSGGKIVWSSGAIESERTIEKKFKLVYRDGGKQKPLGTLSVITGLDYIYKELFAGTRVALLISAITIFFATGFILLIFRNLVTRHMTKIAHFVNTLDMKQEGPSLSLNRPSSPGKKADELDDVVEAINNMRRKLLKSNTELRINEEHLRTVFEAADNVSFITTDIGGEATKVIGFSPGAEKIFGYTAEEILGQKVGILHPSDVVTTFPKIQQNLRDKREGYSGEATLIRKSGELFQEDPM